MDELIRLVIENSTRIGKIIDTDGKSDFTSSIKSDFADMVFFGVQLNSTVVENLRDNIKKLITESANGIHCDCDLFDGNEHSFLELGAWIGDQGLALQLMGVGKLLGLWELLTPRVIMDSLLKGMPEDQANKLITDMAGQGYITIQFLPGVNNL